jgi:cytochrome c oxidase subunit 3
VTREAAAAPQFDDAAQQREASELGIWAFLATEVLFFGALFVSYAVYRRAYPADFVTAARETDVVLGSLNTVILLTSSLTVAVAVKAARLGRNRATSIALLATIGLACGFLVVKAFEYRNDIAGALVPGHGFRLSPPPTQIFWSFYWVATGVHALHVTVGIGVLTTVFFLVRRGATDPRESGAVEIAGLYWHFVDIVWIFLYPMLYLVGRT